MARNVTSEINSGQALNWLQNQLSRMTKRDFMPLPGVSGSRCFEMQHFVRTGSLKIFKILQDDKNFGSLCQTSSAWQHYAYLVETCILFPKKYTRYTKSTWITIDKFFHLGLYYKYRIMINLVTVKSNTSSSSCKYSGTCIDFGV